jgi:hypothetical protein
MSYAKVIGVVLCVVLVGVLWYLMAHGSSTVGTNSATHSPAGSSKGKPSPLIQGRPSAPSVATSLPMPASPDVPSAPVAVPPANELPAAGVSFTADRKGFSNGCKGGTLTLARAAVSFVCPSNPGKSFSATLAEVKGPEDDGIQLRSGEKYHFKIEGRDKDTMRSLFETWYARAHSN